MQEFDHHNDSITDDKMHIMALTADDRKLTSIPSLVRTVFVSGFISSILDLSHFTPDGMTLAVERPDELTLLAPAPTSVHIG